MIYFDNAATTINKPKKVADEVLYAINNYGNPGRSGYPLSLNAAHKIFSTRLSLANFFKSYSPERVIFTLNATMSLNIAVKCFGLNKRTPHILISCFEHNSVYRPVHNSGAEYDVFDVSLTSDEETVGNAVNLVRENTDMIVLTHVSNVCGKILPVREIIAKVKEMNPDIIAVVDAAQSAGVLDIDVNRDNIDILCVPAHKSMLGIAGLGVMILNDNLKIPQASLIEGGTGINSLDKLMPEDPPEHFEAGTPNTPAIAALSAAVEYISSESTAKIRGYEKKLYDKAVDILSNFSNIKTYGDFSNPNYTGAILFNADNLKCEDVSKILTANNIFVRDGYHCSPLAHQKLGTIDTGGVRISFGYHNTMKELDKFYNVLKSIKR
jgi:cysteine desulfurase family protein